ncbi:Uncharacterised protein [Enterobacter cloacae]|uniref:DUF7168 domain-containing protein n=1 Tax=Enterobacter cloacae TaxID=550 RepID=A0A377MBV4_ENTCL|nr:Uncharacterised protein [Enterobacter cloacae]
MATGCRCWFGWHVHVSPQGVSSVRRSLHFYGFSERPEVALYIYTVLQRQLRAATDAHMSGYRTRRILLRTRRRRADQFREGWGIRRLAGVAVLCTLGGRERRTAALAGPASCRRAAGKIWRSGLQGKCRVTERPGWPVFSQVAISTSIMVSVAHRLPGR